jgi:hypothetical protein
MNIKKSPNIPRKTDKMKLHDKKKLLEVLLETVNRCSSESELKLKKYESGKLIETEEELGLSSLNWADLR